MADRRRSTGAKGEKVARAYLEKKGYRILEANFRCPEGEIDLVAQKGDCLVLVEVRTRTGRAFGTPEESITMAKKQKLLALSQIYRQGRKGLPAQGRIDVVAVELGAEGKVLRLEHIENAVSY